jgi:hypothetical protein
MVRGLNIFKNHFAGYSDQYVLIGGTACSLALEGAGLDFRATKDLDIVLHIEALKATFVEAFWDFIKAGKYENRQKSTGKRLFYRFRDPQDKEYPAMLELFSRKPDVLSLPDKIYLSPIPVPEDLSALSSIILDEDYYKLIQAGKVDLDGLPVVKPEFLIPLKILAWMELTARRKEGNKIDLNDIKKHRNDVFRLYQVIRPDNVVILDGKIRIDMEKGIKLLAMEKTINLHGLGLKNTSVNDVAETLKNMYGLE